jgi:hypothetical protein
VHLRNLKALLGTTLCIAGLVCTSCDDFSRFNRRGAAYYAGLATECDSLLARGTTISISEERAVARQTNSLPPAIRQLGASHVQIKERSVQLIVGSYNIIWARSQEDEHLWILSAHRENLRKVLYSERKP